MPDWIEKNQVALMIFAVLILLGVGYMVFAKESYLVNNPGPGTVWNGYMVPHRTAM